MEAGQGQTFPSQFAHHSDYMPAEHHPDSIESFGGEAPAQPSAYTHGGATDPLRRDGSAASAEYAIASARNLHGARYVPGPIAADGSYRQGNIFPESIPSSTGASQFGYDAVNTVPVSHFEATLPALSDSDANAQQQSSYTPGYRTVTSTGSSALGLYGLLPPPQFAPSDREADPRLANRSQFPPAVFPTCDAPRSSFSPASAYQGHGYVQTMEPQPAHDGTRDKEASDFPFADMVSFGTLVCEGLTVTPDVTAVMDKGFFWDKDSFQWTCYRRNYFSLDCHYTLSPNIRDGRLFLKRSDGTMDQVQAIGIRMQAAMDGANGKVVELVQHTAKRDQGPKTSVKRVCLMPAVLPDPTERLLLHGYGPQPTPRPVLPIGPSLACQQYVEPPTAEEVASAQALARASGSTSLGFAPDSANPGQDTTRHFERIQFKNATGNNGKRRAMQQFFHLIVELHVDIRQPGDLVPRWHMIAKKTSEKVVVRGRSPSHYKDSGSGGNGRGNGRGNGGVPSTRVIRTAVSQRERYNAYVLPPPLPPPVVGHNTTAGAPMSYSGEPFAPLGFRPQPHYALEGPPPHSDTGSGSDVINSSPFDDVSGSSSDGIHNSLNPHNFDEAHQDPATISGSGRGDIHDIGRYSYYPAPMYGGTLHQLPVPKREGQSHVSTEPRDHAFRADYPDGTVGTQWQFHGSQGTQGRFQPFANSNNLYPDFGGGNS